MAGFGFESDIAFVDGLTLLGASTGFGFEIDSAFVDGLTLLGASTLVGTISAGFLSND